jgi:hypothetical protein
MLGRWVHAASARCRPVPHCYFTLFSLSPFRFNQFFELDAQLRTEFAENERVLALMPASPQRQSKLLYDHMDLNFVESRRVLLENWMHKLLHIKEVVENATFLGFLGVQL